MFEQNQYAPRRHCHQSTTSNAHCLLNPIPNAENDRQSIMIEDDEVEKEEEDQCEYKSDDDGLGCSFYGVFRPILCF